MKKLSFLLMLFLVASFAHAQKMKDWTWDTYKMKFKAPADFKLIANNAEKFSAGNNLVNLTIYPKKGENLDYNDMEASLVKWATSNKVKYSEAPEYIEDLNGYWGVYVDGESGGYPTTLLLLVDPDYHDISLYVWISYDSSQFDTAVNILKSFRLN